MKFDEKNMPIIEVRNLSVKNRLDGISLHLAAGEMLGLIGANGSGKSTLLQSLAGILPYRGEIRLALGQETPAQELTTLSPGERARKIAYLPQFCDSAWALTAAEIVALGRLPWRDQDAAAIRQAMAATDTLGLAAKRIDQLSGGERARVWLARALATQPRLILADEPIASLDLCHQVKTLKTLRRHAAQNRGVILALHDLGLAARYCDRLCLLHHGALRVFGAPSTVLTAAELSATFGLDVQVDLQHAPPIVLPC
jgi:iron complex transport system ATP-binding protein